MLTGLWLRPLCSDLLPPLVVTQFGFIGRVEIHHSRESTFPPTGGIRVPLGVVSEHMRPEWDDSHGPFLPWACPTVTPVSMSRDCGVTDPRGSKTRSGRMEI